MRQIIFLKTFSQIVFLAIGLVLTACSTLPSSGQAVGSLQAAYVITIRVKTPQTVANLESRYGGRLLTYNTEAQYAILAVNQKPQPNDNWVLAIEKNRKLESTDAKLSTNLPNQLTITGGTTSAATVGMSGWDSWSSGWDSWSSGWDIWSSGQVLPPTPLENNAMGLAIRLPQAHSIARKYGDGVTVAVIDTGIDLNHIGIKNNLVASNLHWDFVDNDNQPAEVPGRGYGHGTAVAGLVLQVAPNAKIMPLRVLDGNGMGDLDDVVLAIDYAVRYGAQIINISLGSDENSFALQLLIEAAKAKKIYIVASVGNESKEDYATFPARMGYWEEGVDYLFGVASIGNNEAISGFSNYGNEVNLVAPGEQLTTLVPNNRIARVSGTSFAAPLVTGALALAYSETQDATARANLGEYLYASLDVQSIWWKHYHGHLTEPTWKHSAGRLDIERLLRNLPGFVPFTPRSGRLEFVNNGNFESQTLLGWSATGAFIDSDAYAGGVFSGQSGAVIRSIGKISQRVTGLKPNTTYNVRAWVHVLWESENAKFGVVNSGAGAVSKITTGSTTIDGFEQTVLTFRTGALNTTADVYFEKIIGNGPAAVDLIEIFSN